MTLAATKIAMQRAVDLSDKFVERAIVALYERQTASEQAVGATEENNGVGFSGPDAEFLSDLAVWIKNSWKVEGSRLSPNQMKIARPKVRKYWRQLAEISAERKQAKMA